MSEVTDKNSFMDKHLQVYRLHLFGFYQRKLLHKESGLCIFRNDYS